MCHAETPGSHICCEKKYDYCFSGCPTISRCVLPRVCIGVNFTTGQEVCACPLGRVPTPDGVGCQSQRTGNDP